MTRKAPDWKSKSAAIRKILLSEWNPIGFDVPEDEYDSCIPGIYRLLRERAGMAAIASHLDQHDIAGSTEPGRSEENQRVAKMLMTLMDDR
jgi:hypothetical protein